MSQIHPRTTCFSRGTALGDCALHRAKKMAALATLPNYTTSYFPALNSTQFPQTLQAARRLAPLHTWTRTWPEPVPPQNSRFSPDFPRRALAICPQKYPAADRCPRNSPAETVLLLAAQNRHDRAAGECFPAQPSRPLAAGARERPRAKSAAQQSCGSRSCSRRIRATPKIPSLPRSRQCQRRILLVSA
jgi:hypothetical protein